ncbi:MAG: FadR/GntR family transcriptional regulator [Cognatishimia sp.]
MTFKNLLEFNAQNAPKAERLETRVYKTLLERIQFGKYAMGDRLPSEADLCQQFGVSRPVLRAALSKLRDSGVIVSRQGAGSFVNSEAAKPEHGFAPLCSIDDISAYFQFRKSVEAEAAKSAALNAPKASVSMLYAIVEEIHELLTRGEDSIGADIKFHTKIAKLSGNRFFAETLCLLRPHWIFVENFLSSLETNGNRTIMQTKQEHRKIVDAIAAGDAAKARKAMEEHIDGSEKRIFKGN